MLKIIQRSMWSRHLVLRCCHQRAMSVYDLDSSEQSVKTYNLQKYIKKITGWAILANFRVCYPQCSGIWAQENKLGPLLFSPSVELHCNINTWSSDTRYQLSSLRCLHGREQCCWKCYACSPGSRSLPSILPWETNRGPTHWSMLWVF